MDESGVSVDESSRLSLQTAQRAVLSSALKTLGADEEGTYATRDVRAIVKAIGSVKKGEQKKGDVKTKEAFDPRNSFRSLIENTTARDGLDQVDLRNANATTTDIPIEGLVSRLLAQLKVIEDHVKDAKHQSVEHLSKIVRKLDRTLEACGLHVKDISSLKMKAAKIESFVDPDRFMHVGGSQLKYFCNDVGSTIEGKPVLKPKSTREINEQVATIKSNDSQKIKMIVRKGFHPLVRPQLWRMMMHGEKFNPKEEEAKFESVENEVWHGHVPEYDELEHHVHVPDFGGPHNLFHSHPITELGEAAVQRILCCLAHAHPDINYCPFLPDLVSLLCLHMAEWEVYHTVDLMIERSKKDEWFFPLDGQRFMCYVESFLLLMQLRMRALSKHIERLGINLEEEVEVWFARLYVSFVPYDLALRIVDCFLSEGAKMLFRIGLALLKTHEKMLLGCHTKQQFLNRLAKHARMHTDIEGVLNEAFNIRGFSRRMLSKLHATHEIKEIPFAKVPVFYLPQFKQGDSKLLTVTQLRKLWKHLPALMRIQDPVQLFTTESHGYNLDILLDRTGHQSAFIIIKTNNKSTFGVFLHWREGLAKHEIGEESFVFTLAPKLQCYHYCYSIGRDPKDDRWGDTDGSKIPEGKELKLGKALSCEEDSSTKMKKIPDMKRSVSDKSHEIQTSSRVYNPIRRQRRMSEKETSNIDKKKLSVKAQSQSTSAPSSPVNKGGKKKNLFAPEQSTLLKKTLENKRSKSRDLGNWRQRKEDIKNSSSDDSDVVPSAAQRRRGNQLRMMDTINGNEIKLWCRRTPQWFGIGSADRVALGIDHKLNQGVTESTTAFYNPPLNGEKYHGDFKCVAIEVWGLTH
mmetsp:Transcript_23038/g.34315  ORF Transcript_23038/g.34315 Transcript_23038/m.34315 type:complete len:857 (-) Transcript_23038:116-2686(-)|eukprot:CAMPEP_0167753206 /NCGR_PEP_ID=MMETSP0110_2-20121227/7577_1 /TAXON_ID=629695 /ORGANISM="Gymnochlora sp., Strain CCMP2014" /LENGTH=856 /DNA_ID=CAMNT_0007638931 /DNA_START=158 /DNA_END=2728 /DNA_ORIENTATION=-